MLYDEETELVKDVKEESNSEEKEFGEEKETSNDEEEVSKNDGKDESEKDDGDLSKEDEEDTEEDSNELEEEEEKEEDTALSNIKKRKEFAQKKINKLLAKQHEFKEVEQQLRQKISDLETKVNKSADTHEKVYTEDQLKSAERKAINDGDLELLAEVHSERIKNLERNLVGRYEKERESQTKVTTEQQKEWSEILEKYSSSDPDFNIDNKSGALYRTAKALYEDAELKKDYAGKGGMYKAVSDAYLELTRLGKSKKKSPKEKILERKLAKTKLKTKLGAGSGVKPDKNSSSNKDSSSLDDYINEHRDYHEKRTGF